MILIPELTPQITDKLLDGICSKIVQLRQTDRQFALVVLSEGVCNQNGVREKYIGDTLAQQIQVHAQQLCETNQPEFCHLQPLETRATILGHIQRSSMPSSLDRLIAAAFGCKAVELIAAENYQQLVVWSHGHADSKPLDQVIPRIKRCHLEQRCPSPVALDDPWIKTARNLGVYMGETINKPEKTNLTFAKR